MAAPEIFYDGGCPVCAREIAFYKTRPGAGALRWTDVNQPGAALGAGLTRQAALARMHVRRADGTLLSGAAAFAEIWRHMPGLRWLGRLLGVPPFGLAAEAAYRIFLVLRRTWR
jgi:predicted DCC family thiol-disulfide oxidoreductase YuxK